MKETTPTVYLLAATELSPAAIAQWLREIGGSDAERCLEHVTGEDAERLIELSGRRCYKSFAAGLNPNVTKVRTDSEEYLENIIESRHGSVLEHASCTWAFEGVSRVFTHELVRHRAGTAFSQESLRYVRLDEIPFWIPPRIRSNALASAIFRDTVEYLENQQRRLAELYKINELPFSQKKALTSDFRRIAPEGLGTGIVFTCNIRALRHVIEMRTSRHAEFEIRLVFSQVAQMSCEKWPMLFRDFTYDMVDGIYEWKPKHSKV